MTATALRPNPSFSLTARAPGLPAPPGDTLSPVPYSFPGKGRGAEVKTFLRSRRSVPLRPPCVRSGGVRWGTRCGARSEPVCAAGGLRGPVESQQPPPPCSSGAVSWQPPVATAPALSVISVRSRAVPL